MDFNLFRFPECYSSAAMNNCKLINPKILRLAKHWLTSYDKPPIVLYGNPGSGKTHLLIAMFREVCKVYNWALYTKSDDLDRELLRSCNTIGDDEGRVVLKYQEVPILFWDDLGVERPNERIQRQFYSILDWRLSGKMPTVFTTNCSPEMLSERFGERIGSRFKLCTWLEFPKVDLRNDL